MVEIAYFEAYPQHASMLATLQYEAISRHWVPHASVDSAHKRLLLHANRNKLPLTLIALQDGEPVGMASLRENDGIRPDLMPWLGSVVVAPAYRGAKIGATLIEAIKQEALRFGFKQLYLLAFDATIPQWYAKLGWKKIGMDNYFGHPVTVMSLSLEPL